MAELAPRFNLSPSAARSAVMLTLLSALGVAAFAWPFLVQSSAEPGQPAHASEAPWLFAALVAMTGALVASDLSRGRLDAKGVAVLGILASLGGALRVLGAGVQGIEPMFFLLVLAGRVVGPVSGFLLGSIAMITGAVLTGGIGPWLPFQMLCAGWVCCGAGLLPRCRGRVEVVMLAGYGLVTGLAYGALMNLWFWPFMTGEGYDPAISYSPGSGALVNLSHYGAFYLLTSLSVDLIRGVLNAALCLLAGRRTLSALRRGTRNAQFL